MPELPEVETIVAYCNVHLQGKRLVRFLDLVHDESTSYDGLLFKVAKRTGKQFEIAFKGVTYYVHLKIQGSLLYCDPNETMPRFTRKQFLFDDGSSLCFIDPRKFIVVKTEQSEINDAPDALEVSAEYLQKAFKNKKIPLKAALMDQNIVQGIGNIYAQEAIFDARLSPFKRACDVSIKELEAILESNRKRMKLAINEGQEMAKDKSFLLKDGWMDLHLSVYGRANLPCPRCGKPIVRKEIAGRGTYVCSCCQRNHKGPYVVAVTGPIHSGKSTISRLLEASGYLRLDADQIAHDYYDTEEGRKTLLKLFGNDVLNDDEVDFSYLRNAVKNSIKMKKSLQKAVFSYVKKYCKQIINSKPSDAKIVLDVPLLVPAHMESLCDYIILTVADPKLRKKRLEDEGRDATSLMKINADYPLAETKKVADVIIHNDGGIDDLTNQLKAIGLL